MSNTKVDVVCPKNKEHNIVMDAWVKWDTHEQKHVIDQLFNSDWYCQDCDEAITPEEILL